MRELPNCIKRQKIRLIPELVRGEQDLENFLSRFAMDVRLQPSMEYVSLHIDRSCATGKICVTGWVTYPSQAVALKTLLVDSPIGEEIDVQMSVLPEETYRRTWFCSCPEETVGRAAPCVESSVVHIWAEGDLIRPILKQEGWILCRAENGYLGWTQPPGEDFFSKSYSDFDHSEALPAVIDEAFLHSFLNTPYSWGGMSRKGIDCSGFTYRIYRELGIILPRDSHQQMLLGRFLDPLESNLSFKRGDLLFFTHEDGRVGHVGCSLGGNRVIHAEEPHLTTFSLCPSDLDYNLYRAQNLVFGKRIFVPR